MHRERAGEQDRLLWSSCLVAVLIAICVSILSYPEWKKGFSSFRSDLEIVAASRGDGQFVDVSWDAGTSTKTLRVPVQHVEATQEWQIEFTYLGAKDRRSQATEVWILQIAAPNVLDWSLVPKAPGWEFRPHALGSDFFGQVARLLAVFAVPGVLKNVGAVGAAAVFSLPYGNPLIPLSAWNDWEEFA